MRVTRTKDGGITIRLSKKQAEALHWTSQGEGSGYKQDAIKELRELLADALGSEGKIGGEADART